VVSILLVPGSHSQQPATTPEETPIPVFPTGSLASFPAAASQPAQKKVFIRRDAADDTRVWVVDSQEILLPASDVADPKKPIETKNGVGFIVPQLPGGGYVAWYEGDASQSIKLRILPQLRPETGIVRGTPGEDVSVAVRIYSPTVTRKGAQSPDEVTIPVKLTARNSAVADLAPAQSPVVSTNRDGFAVWRVRIKDPGITGFIASADDFQPVQMAVVGMRRPARTFFEGEMVAAQEIMAEQVQAVNAAEAKVNERKTHERRTEQEIARARGNAARPPTDAQVQADARVLARIKQNTAEAEAEASRAQVAMADAQQTIARFNEQFRTSQPRSLNEDEMRPGDILLVLGGSFPSAFIAGAETQAARQPALYSHASLYLGKMNGVGMVAEMWSTGYWITPISESTKGLIVVDVYRLRRDIDDAKRNQIVARAQGLYGVRRSFLGRLGRFGGALISYAFEQIIVLGSAAEGISVSKLQIPLSIADLFAGGRKKMICSELVAWIYHDVGLDLNVQHWKSLVDANVLTTEARRMDYTTPNMLARSDSIDVVGRYLGP